MKRVQILVLHFGNTDELLATLISKLYGYGVSNFSQITPGQTSAKTRWLFSLDIAS